LNTNLSFPIFPKGRAGAFQVYNGDYVSTEDGTGIVHTASGFGEDDYEVLRHTEIEPACPIDGECQFTADVPDYQGRFVKDCDKDIIKRLTEEGKLVKRDQLLHPYPHCWRCESPLIYRAIGSWFVKIDPIKKKMIDSNNTIRWVPDHLQQGRFGKWLEVPGIGPSPGTVTGVILFPSGSVPTVIRGFVSAAVRSWKNCPEPR
jgi:isoleucyl-tRNA synthetase